MTDDVRCELCGKPADLHDRDVRFVQPDPVLAAGELEASDIWMSGPDANSSVMMQVNHIGAFVRAILSVKLTAGHTITYGVWVAINPEGLRHVFATWWSAEYNDLVLDGFLANSLEPWGLLGSRVQLQVIDPEQLPHCVDSADSRVRSVLIDEWDHELVLSALP